MMGMVKYIDFESMEEALPAFLTMTLTPMTYSIAVGMCFGLAAHLSINASRLAKDYVANKIAKGTTRLQPHSSKPACLTSICDRHRRWNLRSNQLAFGTEGSINKACSCRFIDVY